MPLQLATSANLVVRCSIFTRKQSRIFAKLEERPCKVNCTQWVRYHDNAANATVASAIAKPRRKSEISVLPLASVFSASWEIKAILFILLNIMGKTRQEKLAEYVMEGSVSKLNRFLKEHKRIDLNSVRLVIHKYQPLLHMACERGHEMMVLTLLQAGADPALPDYTKGDTALHVALRRVLSGHPNAFKPLVLTILKYSPSDILDIENKSGQTARHLLKKFVSDQGMTIGHKVRSEEDEWKEKLSSAWEDDLNENFPDNSYYESFGEEKQQETFDEWADRLASEYRQKRRGQTQTEEQETETERKKGKKRKHQEERQREQKQSKKKVRGPDRHNHLLVMKLRYEKKLAAFEENKAEIISYDDIPWPGNTDNTEHMVAVLVGDRSKLSTEELKKYLKTQQRTWHPDKFVQKFGRRLKDNEREKILEKVKELSQALNKAGEDEKKDEWDF